jgi:hypothetical protein
MEVAAYRHGSWHHLSHRHDFLEVDAHRRNTWKLPPQRHRRRIWKLPTQKLEIPAATPPPRKMYHNFSK